MQAALAETPTRAADQPMAGRALIVCVLLGFATWWMLPGDPRPTITEQARPSSSSVYRAPIPVERVMIIEADLRLPRGRLGLEGRLRLVIRPGEGFEQQADAALAANWASSQARFARWLGDQVAAHGRTAVLLSDQHEREAAAADLAPTLFPSGSAMLVEVGWETLRLIPSR